MNTVVIGTKFNSSTQYLDRVWNLDIGVDTIWNVVDLDVDLGDDEEHGAVQEVEQ
jgi:hypothetical protein